MKRLGIENLYKANGIEDFKLRNTEDLLKLYSINFKEVDGFSELNDANKKIFEKFIVNVFNAIGIESRATLVPIAIYWVEETEYLTKRNPQDDSYIIKGGVVYAISRNGVKKLINKWKDPDFKDYKVMVTETKTYLRFEYKHGNKKQWLHVTENGTEWY